MIDVVVDGRLYAIDDEDPRVYVNHGGEANLYRFSPTPEFRIRHGSKPYVIKLYREETAAQRAAVTKRQTTLRDFPAHLPTNVITPVALAENIHGRVIGYVMELLCDMTMLIEFKTVQHRQRHKVTTAQILTVLRNLHDLVTAIHACGYVIGDFNDKNIMVSKDFRTFLVDADSLGESPGYVQTFVDPLICQPHEPDTPKTLNTLVRTKPFTQITDWYAFAVMAFNLLALVHPMVGGVHRPGPGGGKRRQMMQRIHLRLSVFHPNVGVPALETAVPFGLWPEKLLKCFQAIFTSDARGVFPKSLFGHQNWITCPGCHTLHGRDRCPKCGSHGVVRQPQRVQPRAATTPSNFQTAGTILNVAHQGGTVRYAYHEGAGYRREGGGIILLGGYDPRVTAYVVGERTVFCAGESLGITNGDPVKAVRYSTTTAFGRTSVATNAKYAYWLNENSLVRDNGTRACITIGTLPVPPTTVWAGNRFGLVLVQTGMLTRVLTFDAERTGFTGSTYLPPELGTVVDAHCAINDDYAWLTLAVVQSGRTHHQCYVLDNRARLRATAGNDATWLPHALRSALPYGDRLLVPIAGTGIVQVGMRGDSLVSEGPYRDSDKHVPATSDQVALCDAPNGLLVVTPQSITHLTL